MDSWQPHLDRAEQLARRYPVSAELMYFYRDLVRFRSTMHQQDLAALRSLTGALGAFYQRVLDPPPAPAPCPHAPSRLYADPEFPHIRIEACDTCRTYRKLIDLTLDPDAIPEIDDLASVPLDLWAAAQGYTKPLPNLFGF